MARVTIWVPDAIGRVLIFLFYLVIYSFLLYILGNYQDFLDSTQFILLKIMEGAGLSYIILSLFFLAGRITERVLHKKGRGRDWILSLAGLAVSGLLVIIAEFILVIT